MTNKTDVSRRSFLKKTSAGLGAGLVGASGLSCKSGFGKAENKLSRPVCLTSVDLKELWPDTTTESRIKNILERMENVIGLKPDIICLPELFNSIWVSENKPITEAAEDEDVPGPVTSIISKFAVKHHCYVVCPIHTKKEGHYYNSSLLIDRNGNIAGVYHKTHPTKSEIFSQNEFKSVGITPGDIDQPVFDTDFGKVGMQICYDANWSDGWENLKKKGAEIVLFSSAFPGGRILNYYAWKYGYYILSSTGGDARVIDMSGNDLDSTSTFVRYTWARVNLEKVNLPTWPTRDRLPEIFRKYGDRLKIKVWDYTDVITLESMDPRLKVLDIVKEFDIQTRDELLRTTAAMQDKYRP